MNHTKSGDSSETVWLSPSWLSWETSAATELSLTRKDLLRPYEIHQHAYDKLGPGATALDRVDSITALKRAVSQRVKVLKNTYDLNAIPLRDKPQRDFELLEFLGIVRPLMLKRLLDIRNLLEHEDSEPPSIDECSVFADFVWYFLRSTDRLANGKAIFISYDDPEGVNSHDVVEVNFKNPSSLQVRAFLKEGSFSNKQRTDWIEVQRNRSDSILTNGTTVIYGEIRGSAEQMKLIWLSYFNAS